ncbi:MAG: YjbQ family protein [Chloroflexia bacterium]|nr:YjbQ family protein [Chloroflexia bacterium]
MRETLSVQTQQRSQMLDITAQVQQVVSGLGVQEGRVVLHCPHTTAGLTINEGADPAVRADILAALEKLVPWQAGYRHQEGNAAAHIKSSLMGHSLTVLLDQGRLVLGTWQAIFFCEFDGPRGRRVLVDVLEG